LARETGSALEELDSHKLAVIDPSSGEYQDTKVADDYVSIVSLTLEIQVSFCSLLSVFYRHLKDVFTLFSDLKFVCG